MKSFPELKRFLEENKQPFTTIGDDVIGISTKEMPTQMKGALLSTIANAASLKQLKQVDYPTFPLYDLFVKDVSMEASQKVYDVNQVKPKGDRILVKVIPVEDVSIGGIEIPESARDKPQFGIVIKKGSAVPEETTEGCKIIYGQWAGIPFTLNGEDYLLMRDSDILAYP